MRYSRCLIAVVLLGLVGCNSWRGEPEGHGPQWIDRPVSDLTDKLGNPDRMVRLPPPSLSTVLLYTGGTTPGFAICERNYYVRGTTVIGYSEHGADPNCKRTAGRLND